MIHYILQMVVFQLVFLVIYDVFLRKETFFNHNRAYVLITSVLVFVLPFVKIKALESVFSNTLLVRLPEVVLNDNNFKNNTALVSNDLLASTNFNWWSLIYVGVFIALVFFLYRSFKLYKTIKSNSLENKTDYKIIHLNNSNDAYSFFNYIFLGDLIQNEERQSVLTHEKVHVNEKHSIDLLWFELLKITFWFNPLVYVYQHRVKEIHEFIADSKSSKKHSESYQNVLLNQLFQIKNLSFVNPFYKKALIKNRLIMLSKSKSDRIKLAKYLLIIPMLLGMILYSSCEKGNDLNKTEEFESLTDKQLLEKYVVEIETAKKNGVNYVLLTDKYINHNTYNYLKTREEYYMFVAFYKSILSDARSETVNSLNSKLLNQSYVEYLEEKKTKNAIDRFENNITRGVLREVVKDLNNITYEEQQFINSRLQQIATDVNFSGLAVTDGYNHKLYGAPLADSKVSIYKSNTKEIPFSVVDTAPKFPNCNDLSGEELKKCFSRNLSEIVQENFNINLAEKLNLKGEIRIITAFKVNKNGDLTDVRVRAPHPELEEETKRVLNLIPRLVPGRHQGENIVIAYSLPIKFNIK